MYGPHCFQLFPPFPLERCSEALQDMFVRDCNLKENWFLLQVPPISEHMRTLSGVHLAVDLIEFPKSVGSAILYAVGSSLVADSLHDAKKHAFNDNGRRYKVASLDGTLIAVNGSMSGGQTRYD